MGSLRGVKDQGRKLRDALIELGRLKSLRDPIARLPEFDLSPPQMHTLMWLGTEGPLPAGVLARRIGCSMPSCTGVVDRLEKMGIVARERLESDRRVVQIRLTAKGARMHKRAAEAFEQQLELFLAALDEKDRDMLLGIFERLVENLKARVAGMKESE